MNMPRVFVLVSLVLSLAGCPTPPPAGDGAPVGPPPTPGTTPEGSQDGVAPPPPAGDVAPQPTDLAAGPSTFSQVITEGTPTVTLHVVVQGIERGQIDFSIVEGDGKDGQARAIHVQQFEKSTFDIVAPANFEGKLIASAVAVGEDGLPADKGAVAVVKEPLVIGGQDQTVTLTKPVLP